MTILLLAENDASGLSEQTAKALTAASKIGGDVHVLVAGAGAKAAADAAAKLSGVSKVLVAEDASLTNNLAEPLADLIVSLSTSYDVIVGPATTSAKNVLPRVAALLDVMQISEIVEVVSADTFKRPIYAGNAIQTVQSTDAKKVITVRTASFAAAGEGGSAAVETVSAAGNPGVSSFVSDALASSERPELTSAKVIISAVARSARPKNSRRSFFPSPTSWVLRWAHRAPQWMPAMRRTTGRSARPARSSLPISISRSAFPVRSSTSPA